MPNAYKPGTKLRFLNPEGGSHGFREIEEIESVEPNGLNYHFKGDGPWDGVNESFLIKNFEVAEDPDIEDLLDAEQAPAITDPISPEETALLWPPKLQRVVVSGASSTITKDITMEFFIVTYTMAGGTSYIAYLRTEIEAFEYVKNKFRAINLKSVHIERGKFSTPQDA